MSKVDTEFCDVCGGILYHSIASFRIPKILIKRRWWWHGDAKGSDVDDICSDCYHAISTVLEKRREKVMEAKLEATNKSPADLMEARKPLNENQIRKLI